MKRIKPILAISLIFVITAAVFSGCAKKNDENLSYEIMEDGTVDIISYSDLTTRTEINIPDEIEGKPVVRVRDFSLFNSESLEKITIGKNVKEIGTWAFTNDKRLSEYAVSNENEYFTAVDGVLFTKDMKTVVYYPPAKNIEFDKFGRNTNTSTYDIPDGVEIIRSKAFYRCENLTHITIPDSVKRIEEKAFMLALKIESLKLPASLEFIGKDAFAGCELIEEVTVPAGVTQIDEYAFYNCIKLFNVVMLPKENEMTLGNKWFPTDNGSEIKQLHIQWPIEA